MMQSDLEGQDVITSLRQLEGEELLETLYTLNSYALHPSPPFQNKDDWMAIVRERHGKVCQAAFEDGKPVSISVSTPMTQNMRGKLFPASGVWGVSTDPAARRKGYCRQVMASLLAAERDSGKAFSNLYPFRESFYERMGYVAFPLMKIVRFSNKNLAPLVKTEPGGEIRLQHIGQAYEAYRSFLAEMRLQRHGMAFFDYGDRGRANQNLLWVAQAEFKGKTEGVMLYRTTGEEVSRYKYIAARFYYQTSRARYLLLNWIARHIDQADEVELWLPEDEYPETWLSDLEVRLGSAERPAMCRVLDVQSLDGMDAGEGSFSLRVIDPLCPWNEGSWSFASLDGKLKVTRSRSAECELSIQGLTAMISGTHAPQDFIFRGWGDPAEDLQARLSRMFPPMRPYMHEMF
jgi:predicted acetyltransferase